MAENRNKEAVNEKPKAGGDEAISKKSEEDLILEAERQSLKKAKDVDTENAAAEDGAEAFANLHYGDQQRGDIKSVEKGQTGGDADPALAGDSEGDAGRGRQDAESEDAPRGAVNDPLTGGNGDPAQGASGVDGEANAGAAAQASAGAARTASSNGAGAPAPTGKSDPGDGVESGVQQTPVNEAPTDISLSDQIVDENAEGAVVAVLSSTDPDADDTATYSIVEDASGLFEIVGNELRLREGVSLDHEAQDSFVLTLQVEDSVGNFYTETVTINVADINEGPTDLNLSNSAINENDAGAVVGTLTAFDPDAGDSIVYTVSDDRFEVVGDQLRVKEGVAFDHETIDSFDVTVTATDAGGLSTSQSFSIDINDINEAPTDIGVSNLNVDENTAGATVATLSASDEDSGDTATFSISEDASGLFEIVGNELRLRNGVALDHEAQDAYEITLQVEDSGGNTYTEAVTINVADLNEGPGDIQLSNASIDENAPDAVVGTLTAFDPDADDTLTFAISDDRFEVVGDELRVKEGVAFDHEAIDSIDVTVTATDADGLSATQSFTIDINDLNEGPTDIGISNTSVDENAAGATVATLSATDEDTGDTATFSIADDSSGLFEVVGNELRLRDGVSLDHEAQDAYEITLEVTDSGGASYTETVTINVADLNEGPTDISLTGTTVNENASGATVATLSATDEDSGETATFSISDDASGLFEVVGNELRLRDGVSLDHEAQDAYEITLEVEDSGGNTYTETVTINVADLNEGPADISLTGTTVNENATGATIATLSATDEDAGDTATFSISDDTSGLFEVVGNELRLRDGVSLDHEAQDAYEITLEVEDSGGNTYTETVTINVADLNEGPTDIQLSNASVSENSAGAVVGTLTAFDPDEGDTVSFTVSDDRFEVVGNELKLKDGVELDFNEVGSINVTVTATDSQGAATEQSFTIGVDDVNEGPSLGLGSSQGLQASYFDIGHSLRNLDQIDFDAEPDAVAVVESLDYLTGNESFWDGAPDNFFAARYEGKLVVEEGGTYTFNLASDDGSVLYINGEPVLDNDGLHGTRTRTVTLDLDEGAHDIEVRYFENGGHQTLQLSWSGPDTGGEREVIGGDSFQNGYDADALSIAEDENGAIVAELTVTDPDAGDTHTFSVSDDRFEVVEEDGAYLLKLKDDVSIDFETESSVDVSVTVTDAAGASDTVAYTVEVDNTNAAPEIDLVGGEGLQASYYDIGHSLRNLDEIDFTQPPDAEGVVGSLDYTQGQDAFWDGAPRDFFAARYEGQLVVEEGGRYTFNLSSDDGSMLFIDGVPVLDNDGLHGTRTRTVTLDLDEGAHDIEVRYFENGGAQTLQLSWNGPDTDGATEVIGGDSFRLPGYDPDEQLGLVENADGDVAAVLSITDPDGDAVTYSVDDDRFELVETEDGVALKLKDGVSVDFELADAITVTVTATDEHGESTASELSIPIADVNEGPTDISLDNTSVNENDAGGTVAWLSAADPDLLDTATFSIADDPAGVFEIFGNELKLKDGVSLDHEAQESYEITVQVEDAAGNTYSETVTINVADLNEGPTDISLDNNSVNENDAGGTVAWLSAADPDAGDTATFAITDDPAGAFEVVGNELKLKDGVSLDHEAQDSYDITIEVTDSEGASYSETVTINVADVNEAPVDLTLEPASESGVLSLNQDGGNDDAAIAANMEGFPTDALTVEVTFTSSQTDVGSGVPLFSYAADNGSNNEALIWLESSSGNVTIYLAGQRINTGIPNSSLLDGEEHQVSFTWDQATNEVKFYVDGQEEFSTSVNIRDLRADGTVAFGQEQDAEGGRFDTNQIFEGEIAEARVFDYARSAEEIADNADGPIAEPSSEPGLVSNWLMNENDGGFIRDAAGDNDLQLVNDASVVGGEAYDTPTVVENQDGAVVGTLSATDPDTGGPVSQFAIADDPSGYFEVVGNELKLKDGVSLDHEAQDSYEIVVEAIDDAGLATQQTVTVNVADIGEAPIDVMFDSASDNPVLSLNEDGGNNDYAIASDIEGFPTDALTVEVSFVSSQTDVGNGVPLFSYAANDGSNNEALIWLEGSSGNVHIFLAGQKINTGIPNSALLDGEPHQVSFTWDQSTNEVKFFVDGQEEFSTSVDIRDLRADGTLVLGQEQDTEGGAFDTNQIFEGQISEVRIFDYARSAEEIADNADGPFADPSTEPGLVNNWVMGGADGGEIEDLVGGANLSLEGDAAIVDGDGGGDPTVVENEDGAIVGTISATDPQTGGPVTNFVIADDPSGMFELVGDQLKLKDGVSLDFENGETHEVSIEAIGAGGESTFHTVTVNVADVDETNLILGTERGDRLNGTNDADEIHGLGGNDRINARGGDDTVFGGDGRDNIRGGAGDDVIDGGEGRDTIRGDAGDDTIDGGGDRDNLRGGAGDDVIDGGDGNDTIRGDAGADELRGGAGNDRIFADGDDTVVDGGTGNDRVTVQGNGDFSIDMNASSVERVDGGGGNDTLDATGMTGRVRQYGNGGDDTLIGGDGRNDQRGGAGNDTIIGGDSRDSIRGDAGNDTIDGGGDRDNIRGGAGDDIIDGGDGHDTIYGNAGADQLRGGAGNDRIYADGDDTVVDGGDGNDRVIVQGDGDFSIDMNASSVERVDGGGGNDFIDASGMTDRVRQYGNDGDDTLIGGEGRDDQRGGDGNDTIDGGGDRDRIRGGDGDDTLSGGEGADRISGDAGDDTIIGGLGNDRLEGGDGADVFVYDLGDGNDRVNGGGGDWTDTIQLNAGDGGLGEFGVDWTIELTEGSIVSSDEDGFTFTDNADGIITLNDGSTISFTDIEGVVI